LPGYCQGKRPISNSSSPSTDKLPRTFPPTSHPTDTPSIPATKTPASPSLDNLWRNWGIPNVPTLAIITQDIEANWLLVYQSGDIAVYANPFTTTSNQNTIDS
jgi:hypothetical protein